MRTHSFKLIESTYSEIDAAEVLLTLVNDKIRFLSMKIFSTEEREGICPTHFQRRIEALRKEKELLHEILRERKEGKSEIKIDCKVSLRIKKAKKPSKTTRRGKIQTRKVLNKEA